MHELAIAQSIVDVVEQHARQCQATRVNEVRLQIGEASGIVADSLTFSFEILAGASPLLEHASLLIERVPHRAYCHNCAHEFLVERFVPCCPRCAEWSTDILSGTELQVIDMEVV